MKGPDTHFYARLAARVASSANEDISGRAVAVRVFTWTNLLSRPHSLTRTPSQVFTIMNLPNHIIPRNGLDFPVHPVCPVSRSSFSKRTQLPDRSSRSSPTHELKRRQANSETTQSQGAWLFFSPNRPISPSALVPFLPAKPGSTPNETKLARSLLHSVPIGLDHRCPP
jgi:hypothetical protein